MAQLSLPINYNWLGVYIDGDEIEAIDGKATLPAINRKRITKQLPGGETEYNGKRYEAFSGSISVMMPTSDAIIASLQSNKTSKLSIQAAFQEDNLATGGLDDHTIIFDMDVHFFGMDESSPEPDAEAEIPMAYNAKSIKISIDGAVIVDIDIRTGKDIINNVDLAKYMRLSAGLLQ